MWRGSRKRLTAVAVWVGVPGGCVPAAVRLPGGPLVAVSGALCAAAGGVARAHRGGLLHVAPGARAHAHAGRVPCFALTAYPVTSPSTQTPHGACVERMRAGLSLFAFTKPPFDAAQYADPQHKAAVS